MKKILISLTLALALVLGACGGGSTTIGANAGTDAAAPAQTTGAEQNTESELLRIGLSPAPHAAIVEQIVPLLEAEGVKLEIIEYTDYVIPNNALAEGEIDANYFQHIPYFDDFIAANNLDLENLGGVHIEPMGVFSTKISSLDELQDGDEVMIPNDPTNAGRALLLLQAQGVIKLKDGGSVTSTEADISENPKNLKFTALEAAAIPKSYEDASIAVINGNYAIDNGLNPVEDSIAIEGKDSPYVNIVAVRKGDAQKEKFQKLIKALQSDIVKEFIEKTYDGSVVPAF